MIVLAAGNACGQAHKGIIHVIDQKNHEPVAFAHICFEGLKSGLSKYSMTSIEGKVPNEVKEVSKIAISYMGYSTWIDTIRPGESIVVELKPTVLNMDEVVVTAQYTPERADKSIYRIEVINSRQIELKAASNLADLLKDHTSMRVSQNGVLGTSLKIQGLSGENIKFLMDGVPMIGRMEGNFDLNQINLYNVDHVEVIEGPMSVIYGSNAIAGVINIISKENKASVLSTSLNTNYESVGVYDIDASATISHKQHGFSVSGGRHFFGGYSYKDTSRIEDFKPRRQYFFDTYYRYGTQKLRLKLSGGYFNELLIDKGPLRPLYFETAQDNEFKTIRYNGRLDAVINLPHSRFINLLGSYSYYGRTKQSYFKDFTILSSVPLNTPDGQDTTAIGSVIARGTFSQNDAEKKFNFQAGFEMTNEDGTGKRFLDTHQSIGDYAAFVSVKWDPVKILSIQPGVRGIYNTKYNAPLVYALSLKLTPAKDLSLRASYARGFRAPDLKELYLFFVDVNHNIQGNPDLKSEWSNNFNLNLNYSKETNKLAWSADLTGFYNLVDDVILMGQQNSVTNLYTYFNVDKYKTLGYQGTVSFGYYPSLQMTAGISQTGLTGSMAAEGANNNFIFETDFTGTASYHFLKQELTFALFYKYTGKSPVFQLDNSNNVKIGTISPYNTMDFTVTKGFWIDRIRLSAGVKNIFDVKNITTTGMVSGGHGDGGSGYQSTYWGRTLFVKLSFTFNKYK